MSGDLLPLLLWGLLPEHLLLLAVVVLMLLDMLRADERLGAATLAVALAGGLAVVGQQFAGHYTAEIVPGELRVDRLALLGKGALLACGLAATLGFRGREPHRYWLLLAGALLGGLVVAGSTGFASLFLALELVSLPGFALMLLGRGQGAAPEGAFKYLLLSSLASALLLFGASLAYGVSGSLALPGPLQGLSAGGGPLLAAALLALAGVMLKLAVFPFHAWAPDAYAAARLRVTAVLAGVAKVAVLVALLRLVGDVQLAAPLALLVGAVGVASIGFGNLAALGQPRFRRLLGYSSIAHAGYMVVALVDRTGHRADDLVAYGAIYGLAVVLACAAFAALVPSSTGAADDDRLAQLDGAFARRPGAALLLAAALLSLAGLPPLPGFFAKLLVFRSVIASDHLVLAILAFVGSFLGLAVYVGAVVRLFRTDRSTAGTSAANPPAAVSTSAQPDLAPLAR